MNIKMLVLFIICLTLISFCSANLTNESRSQDKTCLVEKNGKEILKSKFTNFGKNFIK
jgi:hypothetical protein